jgi:bacterial/archaeal transporter family protein
MRWLIWALLSAMFAGLTAVLAKVGVSTINSNLATAIRTTVILVFTWAIALGTGGTSGLTEISKPTWIFLLLSGVATGLSWLCYFRALQIGDVVKVAPIDKLSVVAAMLLSITFLGERLSLRGAIGATLIVSGAVVLALP